MNKKSFYLVGIMVFCLVFQGCGLVVHGTKQDLAIDTVPTGITARIGGSECTTPCTLTNVPRDTQKVYFRKGEGGEKTYYLSSDKDVNYGASVFGNICFLELGLLVDFLSGSAYTIKPLYIRYNDLSD